MYRNERRGRDGKQGIVLKFSLPALCLLAIFVMHGCCGRVPLPPSLTTSWQGTVWKISISRSGEGLFKGLLVCGETAGLTRATHPLSCSLIDSTGITLMKLLRHNGRFEVVTAMPPFSSDRISEYIVSDLEIILACADNSDGTCHARGICSIEECPCPGDGAEDERCLWAGAGPFDSWTLVTRYEPSDESRLSQVTVTRPWSGMQMQLKRLE
jgi:hypothetical protein